MENFKTKDIENISNHDHINAEKRTCVLEESDIQCGYVFYNEITRLLKFYCMHCQETYDNIEHFCHHLSDHINESNEELYTGIELQAFKNEFENAEGGVETEYSEDMSLISLKNDETESNSYPLTQKFDEDTRDAFEYQQQCEEESSRQKKLSCEDIVDNLNNEEMLIEEIEDADEIQVEVEKEMLDQMEGDNNKIFISGNNSSTEEVNNEDTQKPEKSLKRMDNQQNGNGFEECFIKETNIDKIRSEGVCVLKEKNNTYRKALQRKRPNMDLLRCKRRRKKVTTVKVIAVKNRIAELYERIQNEQQKSQQYLCNDFLNVHQEHETQDAIDRLIKEEVEPDKKTDITHTNHIEIDEKSDQTSSEITRKIIGETLITLIPEGTKIPDKMPSHLVTPINKEFIDKEHLTVTKSSSFNRHNAEDKKEKLAICPACGKTFRSHFSLTIHKRIHYLESDSAVKLAHKCSDCDQLFNKLSQLKHHVESVHYPDGFICKICNRQLSSISLLERHMVKVHLDRPFNCKKCNKNFSDPLTFEEHLASHNSGEVFKCSTCGRKYSTEYFLLEHMRNHKEQVPQTCVVCGKVTLRITQHMKIHTPRPKRLLSCSECGKVFNFSSGLSHHFKIMHKLPRPPPKLKKETQISTFKRKRRSRTNERGINKKKQVFNFNPTDSTFVIGNEKFSDQIIEEQIEVPHEVYDTSTAISNLKTSENLNIGPTENSQNACHKQMIIKNFQQDATINRKEEEAKRVIVELIQNSTYTSFFPDNLSSVLEVTPPIAREETISAVNSIVHDC